MKLCEKSRAELVSMGFVALSDETNLSLHSIVNLVGPEKVGALLTSTLPLPSPADSICDICGMEIEPVSLPRDTAELRSVGKVLAAIAEAVDGPHALYDVLCSRTAEDIADSGEVIDFNNPAFLAAAITAYRAETVWRQALQEMCGCSSDSAEECSVPSNILYFPGCNANNCPEEVNSLWDWLLDDPDDSDDELPF